MKFEQTCVATLSHFVVTESGNLFASSGILLVIHIYLLWTHVSIFRLLFGTNKSTGAPTHLGKVASRTFF